MFGKLKHIFQKKTEVKSKSLYTALSNKENSFWNKLKGVFNQTQQVDESILEEMEEVLLSSDISFETTSKILEHFQSLYEREAKKQNIHSDDLSSLCKELLFQSTLSLFENQDNQINLDSIYLGIDSPRPYVILVVGVNGVGKTTTIAKIAHFIKQEQASIIMGAGDTFRAGAVEQLNQWCKKLDIPLIKRDTNSSPSAVAYDTITAATSKQYDVALIDTSGRLHNNNNLMSELKKMVMAIQKQLPKAPHEILLIIDGTSGQNALEQAKKFCKTVQVTGIVVTKLDGSAKGGVLISINNTLQIPIKYIGVGEQLDDLISFNPKDYLRELFQIGSS